MEMSSNHLLNLVIEKLLPPALTHEQNNKHETEQINTTEIHKTTADNGTFVLCDVKDKDACQLHF